MQQCVKLQADDDDDDDSFEVLSALILNYFCKHTHYEVSRKVAVYPNMEGLT